MYLHFSSSTHQLKILEKISSYSHFNSKENSENLKMELERALYLKNSLKGRGAAV